MYLIGLATFYSLQKIDSMFNFSLSFFVIIITDQLILFLYTKAVRPIKECQLCQHMKSNQPLVFITEVIMDNNMANQD